MPPLSAIQSRRLRTAPYSTTTPTVETKTSGLAHDFRADASQPRAVDAPSGMTDVPLTTWFHEARHLEKILGEPVQNSEREEWRKIKDRMKTVSVALVLCLNIGVDPPDVIKPQPCARREAWVDPALMNPLKVPQRVAGMLQKAYERLQPRARYKSALHPTTDNVKTLCEGLRKSAKEERVLFHYNGHGVPLPTENSEVWVFNQNITQYIPLSLHDIHDWMQTPSVYVWDCNSAGTIVRHFEKYMESQELNYAEKKAEFEARTGHIFNDKEPDFTDCIQLGACAAGELLPTDPDLPADLFTSCLTTPIQTSMIWYVLKSGTRDRYQKLIEELPGTLTDRKSVLGELNWIFTAITDSIAWNRLPKDVFQKLFRQDLLVASLFRSYLLAEKIMRDHGCKVVSYPKLPSVFDHPLWNYWEYTIELCLINLYNHRHTPTDALHFNLIDCFASSRMKHSTLVLVENFNYRVGDTLPYTNFFIEQLQAFDAWLRFDAMRTEPPDQLPVVLQVLLSQVHRVTALELLARYLDMNTKAVLDALFVGVFPYVLKLLQSTATELRPSLAFIWAKILIVDPKCCDDLLEHGYDYFLQIVRCRETDARHKIIPVFIICTLMKHCSTHAQQKFHDADYLEIAIELLSQYEVRACKMLCVWLLISLGMLWHNNDAVRWQAVRIIAPETVTAMLHDEVPEVRAAGIYALGYFMSNRAAANEHAYTVNYAIVDQICERCAWDGSVLVRLELVVAIQWFVLDYDLLFASLYRDLDKNVQQYTQQIKPRNGAVSANSTPTARTIVNGNGNGARTPALGGSLQSNHRMTPFSSTLSLDGIQAAFASFVSPTLPPARPTDLPEEEPLRERIFRQWRYLERRAMRAPLERIWVVVLRLYFDPMEQVHTLAKDLVNLVITRVEQIEQKVSSQVRFTIGSPTHASIPLPTDAVSVVDSHRRHGLSRTRTPSSGGDPVNRTLERVETPPVTLTPKRRVNDRDGSRHSSTKASTNAPTLDPVINTEFVEWCSKAFNKPIYKTLYESDDGSVHGSHWMIDGVSRTTKRIPSDWASHTGEGVEQHALKDLEFLRKTNGPLMPKLALREPDVYCMRWSYLRPFVYICDGRKIYGYNTDATITGRNGVPKRNFTIKVNEDQLFDDPMVDVIVVNGRNHELLLACTRDGLMSVWDPSFDEHGHNVKGEPKMLTSNHLLNDQTRIYATNSLAKNKRPSVQVVKKNHTLYDWDQTNGHLLVAGNVPIVRQWDAWSEKTRRDIPLDNIGRNRGTVECICTNETKDLLCVGFECGAHNIYDLRCDKNECIMRHQGQPSIIGASFVQGNILAIGYSDGCVRKFDSRQYQEPIEEFWADEVPVVVPAQSPTSFSWKLSTPPPLKVPSRCIEGHGSMTKFVGHEKHSLIACAMSDATVRLFDLSGSTRKPLGYNFVSGAPMPGTPASIGRIPKTVAMQFHSHRVHLGVASQAVYVTPDGTSADSCIVDLFHAQAGL